MCTYHVERKYVNINQEIMGFKPRTSPIKPDILPLK
jgi:hypothetical protein